MFMLWLIGEEINMHEVSLLVYTYMVEHTCMYIGCILIMLLL